MSDYPVIPPYEQAYLLNKQLIARAHLFRDPVITIGGQAVQYWVSYYYQLYRNALPDARLITSVDVDYAARRHDITAIARALGVDANLNDAGQPPSLARFLLIDEATRTIKAVKGRFLPTRRSRHMPIRWTSSIFLPVLPGRTSPVRICCSIPNLFMSVRNIRMSLSITSRSG